MAISSLQILTPADVERRLAARVRSERLRLDWRQTTLAERSGVSIATIRRYERTGKTSLRNLLLLLEALGLLDGLEGFLRPPPPASMDELEARAAARETSRRRGSR